MKASQWVRLVLSLAVMSVVGVMAVMACAPAAPASQSGSEDAEKGSPTETPIPTATPYPDDCVEFQVSEDVIEIVCPEPGPREIGQGLRKQYNVLMAEKELAAQEGRRSTLGPIMVEVRIKTRTADAVDDVVAFLEENGARVFGYNKEGSVHAPGIVIAYVNIELLPAIIAIEGMGDVVEVYKDPPAGSNLHVGPGTMTAVERMFVDHWHDAGVTGAGVEVAVIDADFRDFRARILPMLSQPVEFLCYNVGLNPMEGQLPLPPAVPPASFSACETSAAQPPVPLPTLRPHGTDVVAALLEVAPDVKLYISNANDRMRLERAVDWLTAKGGDNAVTGADYDVGANNAFDVKIINRSRLGLWDGLGDGTSGFDVTMNRSPINVVADAVERGALWVNAAGNGALRTWFGVSPVFNGSNRLEFGLLGASGSDCNEVTMNGGTEYVFQLRWNGSWPQGNVGTEPLVGMILRGPLFGASPPTVAMGTQGQLGILERHPWREMKYKPPGTGTGRYCVYVSRDLSRDDPSWVQLQMFVPSGTLGHASGLGSIDNPAESRNRGMLAVGAFTNASPPVIKPFSALGPLPESSITKPDINGLNTDLSGTSFSAPRVAGMAALRAQGEGYTTPVDAAGWMLSVVHEQIAIMPDLSVPTNVRVSHSPCRTATNLGVRFDHSDNGIGYVLFHLKAVQVGVQGVVGSAYETVFGRRSRSGSNFDTMTDRGSYDVTVKACTIGGYCGAESSPPTRFTTTAMVCKPMWFRAVSGDGQATLLWNPDPDATSYEVEDANGNSRFVAGEEHVIEGLTNGTEYRYRVRSLGPGGPSDWTPLRRVNPSESRSRPQTPTGLLLGGEIISRRYPGLSLKWEAIPGDHLYEIKVLGGGADDWGRLTFQPVGWDSPYSARFFGGFGNLHASPPVLNAVEAFVSGLVPGTEYRFAVRAARERDSSSDLDYSPWSEPVTLKTSGVRPASAPGKATAPALKAPPEDLMAVVDGTTVDLSWTAATNPNYVRQVVFRRDFAVNPIQWTEIPVGLNDATYSDTGLTSGITYRYRVRSYKQMVGGNYGESGHAEAVIP